MWSIGLLGGGCERGQAGMASGIGVRRVWRVGLGSAGMVSGVEIEGGGRLIFRVGGYVPASRGD